MFFKNATIYRLPEGWSPSHMSIVDQLGRGLFRDCGPTDAQTRGWVPPRAANGHLVECSYGFNRDLMLCLQVQEKVLPSACITREVVARAEQLEAQQGYKPGRKQLKELRERVTEELLAKALVRDRKTYVWIDADNGWLVIDTASQARAEEVLEHLRHCLDEFPVQLPRVHISPTSAMADWLAAGEAPFGFTLGQECEVKSRSEGKGTVKYSRVPVDGDDVKAHLASGKLPTKLALTWNDRATFVLTETLVLKRLFLLDLALEGMPEVENADEQFDADFALMTGELKRLLADLVDALGGFVKEEEK